MTHHYVAEQLPEILYLGRQTTYGITTYVFDCSEWTKTYGELTLKILPVRPGEEESYVATNVSQEGSSLVWNVNGYDTELCGIGAVEIAGYALDVKVLSATMKSLIDASSSAIGQKVPEEAIPILDEIRNTAAEVNDAVLHTPIIGENGNWYLWDFETNQYVDSGNPSRGRGKGVDYELIETITLKSSMAVERTQEPDQKPYGFTSMFLRFTALGAKPANSGNVQFMSNGTRIARGYLSSKDAQGNYYAVVCADVDKGYWRSSWSDWNNSNSNVGLDNRDDWGMGVKYAQNEFERIDRINTPILPAGTVIEIWGVRAYA